MKTLVLAAAALVLGIPSYAQYSARTLTSKIAPQPQQPAQPARPAPAYAAPAQPAAAARALTPAEAARAKAQKNKNDVKQFEFYKRRAEEGSDHAQYELGLRYLAGKGTDRDDALGREWLAKAAKQGHSQAAKKLVELGPAPVKAAKVSAAVKATPAQKK